MIHLYVFLAVAVCVALAYFFGDINFHLHCFWSYLYAKFFRSKINLTDVSSLYGVCWLTDLDIYLIHMNNTRYFRELEYGRIDFFVRCGLDKHVNIFLKGPGCVAGSTMLRYRHAIKTFSLFKVVTSVKWWDAWRACYVEQKIVSPSDGKVLAIGLTKLTFLNSEVFDKLVEGLPKPSMPEDLRKFIDANDAIESHQQQVQVRKTG